MKLKNSLTTVLIFIIVSFYIVANYATNVTWGGIPLQLQLLLVGKAGLSNGAVIGVFAGQWWRVATVALTHANWLHLGSNMLVFFQLGNIVERYYGKARYAFLLLASLVISSLAALFLVPDNVPCVGASGMIFGLFGVMLVTGRKMGVDYRQVLGMIALNLLITFAVPGIAWQAHIGGLAGGYLAAWLLTIVGRGQSTRSQTW
jgi:membrane associated rhomboid family serine protease